MHTIQASYRIVTPMFLGDAEQKASGIRPPSVKGALRFWWRALNWGRFRKDAPNDAKALQNLHRAEAELFGAASDDGDSGQGRFLLRAGYTEESQQVDWDKPLPGMQYLLGQGLYHFKNGLQREYLKPGTLELELLLKPKISEEQRYQLRHSLLALGLFGGLGSRARHGLGSVTVESIEDNRENVVWVPQKRADLGELDKRFQIRLPETLPPFTAFSKLSRFDLSAMDHDPLLLLAAIGQQMQLYRSWGRKKKVNGQPAEQNFPDDHHSARAAADGQKPKALPRRMIFGLPHNYFFSSDRKKLDIAPAEEGRNRRASPLFLHIHRFADGSYGAFHLLLPAVFLPPADRIQLKGKKIFSFDSPTADWDVIHQYLNRFQHRETFIHVL